MKDNNLFGVKTKNVLAVMAAALVIMGGCTTFKSITVRPPPKTVFGQGEMFSYAGLQVTGTTEKGETKDLSGDSRIRVFGYDPDITGEQTITVDYRGVTAAYTITVVAVESIAIVNAPAAARQGMDIDRSALSLTASYGGKIAPLPVQGSAVRILGYHKDSPGTQTIMAEYYGNTAAFTVHVAPLTGIRITKPPAKLNYLSGEPLDLTGIEAAASWQGAGDAPVTPEYVSGFTPTAQGTQTVIVEALGKRASFTVTVKEPATPALWTPAHGGFARNITGIAYGNGKFVAAGFDDDRPNEGIIAYSSDGIIWMKAPSYVDFKITRVFFGGGKFVIGGYNTEKGAYLSESSDGIHWQAQSFQGEEMLKQGLGDCTAIAYGRDKQGRDIWVAAFSSSRIRVNNGSGTGLSWTIPRISNAGNYFQDEVWSSSISGLLFDGSRFIAFDRAGRYIYSTNGSRWEQGGGTIAFGGRPVAGAASGNGKFIGAGPNNALAWSVDGIIWTAADHKGEDLRSGDFNGVAYGFGVFVAVNSRGSIIYSRDGFIWTKVAASTFGSTAIRDVAYGNGRFVAVGDNGRIAYSNKID